MLIGIDLRFLENNTYSHFAENLVQNLVSTNPDIQFNIYINNNELSLGDSNNYQFHRVKIKCGSFQEQFKYNNILKKDKNTVMLFFNHNKPIFYKGEYFTIIPGLKDIFYQNFGNYFQKYSYLFLLEKNLKNSKKILCLDENTKDELIERFNLEDEKIKKIDGFFIENNFTHSDKDISLDITTKFQIKNKYLIYSGGDGIEKNIDRLVDVFDRLHNENNYIDLVFLGGKIGKNIHLRNAILKCKLQNNIHFIDHINPGEEKLLYKQSLGVIFPSLYESFPFRLSNPLMLNIPILSSRLKSIESIFGDSLDYFSPISSSSILIAIKEFITKKHNKNYKKIIEKNSLENTSKQIIDIIR